MAASAESLGSSQLSSGIQCSSTDNVVRGYKEEFSPPLKAELLCLLCNLGLRDPVKDGHGHVFCRTCFSDSVSKNGPICPIYRSPMSTTEVDEDADAKGQVLESNVLCRQNQHGCLWKGPLKALETHLNTCKFVAIRRGSWEQQYKHNGAQKSASKNDYLEELEQKVFELSTAILNAKKSDQRNQQTIADLWDRVGQLEEQLKRAILNAQHTDQRNQQTIADLTERVSQLEQQLGMAMTDLTNRVRQLEEKGEEEELASHMKNLSI